MHEQTLRQFFQGIATARELQDDLQDSAIEVGPGLTHHPIVDMASTFCLEPSHLVRLCGAVLDGDVEAFHLRAIGFCLLASDTFEWDTDTPGGARLGEVVAEWSCPEVNYPLTLENVAQWQRLLRGEPATFSRWGEAERPALPTTATKTRPLRT